MKIKNIITFIRKNIVMSWIIGLLILGGFFYFLFFNKDGKQETFTIQVGDFLQQVSVSGKVVATESLDFSFEQSGIIKNVYVKVGDVVEAGKLLVSQDTAQLYAQLEEMQAGIDLQKAKLSQLLAGSSQEDIKIKKDAVTAAEQDVKDSYNSALVSLSSAYNAIYNAYTTAVYIQKTYFILIDQEGTKVQNSKNGILNSLTDAKSSLETAEISQDAIDKSIDNIFADLNNTYAYLKIIRDQCDESAYYTKVSTTDKTTLDTQRANINTELVSVASAKESLNSHKTALQLAKNQLELINASSRPTDIAVFEAQIKQAEASAKNVITQINKRQIFSPIDGVITEVGAKVGSILSAGQVGLSLISNEKFQIKGYVPEIYIPLVKVGDNANITLDSFGSEHVFPAKVISIDPSETIKDGVSTYQVVLQFIDDQQGIKDGMSANVVIITNKKENVISIPQGLIRNDNGKKFVKIKVGEQIIEKEVLTGEISSSGQVEILSGLTQGDVLPIK